MTSRHAQQAFAEIYVILGLLGKFDATDLIPILDRHIAAALADMKASFDNRWKADMRAIKMWQEAHPGKENVWPDHADLVVWLMERLDSAPKINKEK